LRAGATACWMARVPVGNRRITIIRPTRIHAMNELGFSEHTRGDPENTFSAYEETAYS
jgi:hypothetical protein